MKDDRPGLDSLGKGLGGPFEAEAPGSVAVIGGGRMGVGIAHAFLLGGALVTVVEKNAERRMGIRCAIRKMTQASIDRGWVAENCESILCKLGTVNEIRELPSSELVIEAVPENVDIKCTVLSEVSDAMPTSTVIATNTSSISLALLADQIVCRERFLGMHFFNPVPASQLVELVSGPDTGAGILDAARGWVAAIGKVSISVSDSPGFASSRLGVLAGLEAIRMVEEGVASVSDIDTAMILGYKHPVGPLKLSDLVGLDVRLGIAEYLASRLGSRFEPPELLRSMVAEGRVGRKSGYGFYSWGAGG